MKKVVAVSADDVCKMRKKSNYTILESNQIQDYIRKYITSIVIKENNIIKRINNDYKKNKFFVKLVYDGSLLNNYEIMFYDDLMFDDDLMGFDFINTDKNNIIFFNYNESHLKLEFDLIVQNEYKSNYYELLNYVCLHQLIGDYTCKLANICTKYK